MLYNELFEVKRFREEAKIVYPWYRNQIPRDCAIACSLPTKDECLLVLKALVYICACNLDVQSVEMAYSLARTRTLISEDYTIHDFVIGTCYERGDIVTAFKWVLLVNQDKENALRLSIGATFDNFKFFPNLVLVYTDFLNTLKKEYLPQEEGTSSFAVRDAVAILLARLLRFRALIERIEQENTPSVLYCKLWLEHKLECANIQIESIEDIIKNATFYWCKLADYCLKDQDAYQEIGRLFYPMKWYLAHQGDEDRIFFEKILISLLYVNHHITRIKEMLNIPLDVFSHDSHITMYMRPGKFKRIFTPTEGTEQVHWSLTCADHMNDDFEGAVFFDYLKECGVSVFDQKIRQFGLLNSNERSSVFLGSVGGTFDDEYMYELYATDNDIKGFCVDIDVSSFDDIIEDSLANDEFEWICPLYRLLYADTIDDIMMPNVKKEIKKLGKSLVIVGLFAGDYEKDHSESAHAFYKIIYQMLEEIIYLFKKKTGPDNTITSDNNIPIIRNWEREREMRMMKCVRGKSHNIVESEKTDSQNRHYLNYTTQKRIIVKNVYGGSTEEMLKDAREHISKLQKDLPN